METLRASWHFKLLSVVVAIGLWVFVQGTQNPNTTQYVNCPVTAVNVPSDLAVIEIAPTEVQVRVRGRAHRLDVANFDEMRMVADLRKAETGEQDAALMPEGVPSGVQVLSYSGTAVVKLDKIIERTKPAVVDQTGRPARGYVITGPPVT